MQFVKGITGSIAICVLVFSVAAYAGSNDTSSDGQYSFQIETVSGSSLPTYYWNGYTFVEGREGQAYNIRVFNHSARRVEAVVTVDGRDTISGKIGDYHDNRGYVIDPYSSVLIKGFRTSWSNVAGFYFTDIEDSYSARMGSGQHVGVIGVAVFEEKERRRPRPRPIQIAPRNKRLGTGYGRSDAAKSEAAEPLASMDDAEGESERAYSSRRRPAAGAPAARQSIGTGYGNREYSPATQTEFQRKTRRPGATLAIYYDDRDSLMNRGILPKPRPKIRRSPTPNPFPANRDPEFAPPPPPYYWE